MRLFKRNRPKEEPVDPNARSPETGLKYKDIALLGQMVQAGADLTKTRHALYYLYFRDVEKAGAGAVVAREAGYTCEVRDPMPIQPDQWSLVCERPDALLDIEGVKTADDLFQGIADAQGGDFDGWEAAI